MVTEIIYLKIAKLNGYNIQSYIHPCDELHCFYFDRKHFLNLFIMTTRKRVRTGSFNIRKREMQGGAETLVYDREYTVRSLLEMMYLKMKSNNAF